MEIIFNLFQNFKNFRLIDSQIFELPFRSEVPRIEIL